MTVMQIIHPELSIFFNDVVDDEILDSSEKNATVRMMQVRRCVFFRGVKRTVYLGRSEICVLLRMY